MTIDAAQLLNLPFYADGAAVRVYLHLLAVADADGVADVSIRGLCDALGMSTHTAIRAASVVCEAGAAQHVRGGFVVGRMMLNSNKDDAKQHQTMLNSNKDDAKQHQTLARANKESNTSLIALNNAPLTPHGGERGGENGQNIPYPSTADEVVAEGRRQGLLLTEDEASEFLDYWRSMGWRTTAGQVRDWRYKLKRSVCAARSHASDRRMARLPNVWRRPPEGYGESDDFDKTGF